jgi:hypothetical protein
MQWFWSRITTWFPLKGTHAIFGLPQMVTVDQNHERLTWNLTHVYLSRERIVNKCMTWQVSCSLTLFPLFINFVYLTHPRVRQERMPWWGHQLLPRHVVGRRGCRYPEDRIPRHTSFKSRQKIRWAYMPACPVTPVSRHRAAPEPSHVSWLQLPLPGSAVAPEPPRAPWPRLPSPGT